MIPSTLTERIAAAGKFDEEKHGAWEDSQAHIVTSDEHLISYDAARWENTRLKPLIDLWPKVVEALKTSQKYICEYSNNCMPCPEGILSKSHGCECMELSEALTAIEQAVKEMENT